MRKTNSAFTLVEVIVAVSILAVVMVSVFEVYFGVLSLNRRLEFARSLQENARGMTEMFAKEIRERGIDLSYYDGSTSDRTLDYSAGNAVLAIRPSAGGEASRYYLMKDSVSGPVVCGTTSTGGCYLGRESLAPDGTSERVRITDDRVRVDHLSFHIVGLSADSVSSGVSVAPGTLREAKVTAAFDLSIPDSKGVSPDLAKSAKIRAQTTISEKLYKSY